MALGGGLIANIAGTGGRIRRFWRQHRSPTRVISGDHGVCLNGFVAEILLPHYAVSTNYERHDSRISILGRPSQHGKAGEAAFLKVVLDASLGGALLREYPVVVAVERLRLVGVRIAQRLRQFSQTAQRTGTLSLSSRPIQTVVLAFIAHQLLRELVISFEVLLLSIGNLSEHTDCG